MSKHTSTGRQTVHEKAAGTNGGAGNGNKDDISETCFNAIVEHWFKARIDGPMQTLTTYEETIKQLATLGGLLPAILIAAYKVFAQPTPALQAISWEEALKQPSTRLFGFSLVAFLTFLICLVVACEKKLKMGGPTRTPRPRHSPCDKRRSAAYSPKKERTR